MTPTRRRDSTDKLIINDRLYTEFDVDSESTTISKDKCSISVIGNGVSSIGFRWLWREKSLPGSGDYLIAHIQIQQPEGQALGQEQEWKIQAFDCTSYLLMEFETISGQTIAVIYI